MKTDILHSKFVAVLRLVAELGDAEFKIKAFTSSDIAGRECIALVIDSRAAEAAMFTAIVQYLFEEDYERSRGAEPVVDEQASYDAHNERLEMIALLMDHRREDSGSGNVVYFPTIGWGDRTAQPIA